MGDVELTGEIVCGDSADVVFHLIEFARDGKIVGQHEERECYQHDGYSNHCEEIELLVLDVFGLEALVLDKDEGVVQALAILILKSFQKLTGINRALLLFMTLLLECFFDIGCVYRIRALFVAEGILREAVIIEVEVFLVNTNPILNDRAQGSKWALEGYLVDS